MQYYILVVKILWVFLLFRMHFCESEMELDRMHVSM